MRLWYEGSSTLTYFVVVIFRVHQLYFSMSICYRGCRRIHHKLLQPGNESRECYGNTLH